MITMYPVINELGVLYIISCLFMNMLLTLSMDRTLLSLKVSCPFMTGMIVNIYYLQIVNEQESSVLGAFCLSSAGAA